MKKMKVAVTPLGANVLIAPTKPQEKTASGIFLPETASKEKPQRGTVMAVGEDDAINVAVGQEVIYSRYAGTEVTVDGNEYLIVKNEDVLAVIG